MIFRFYEAGDSRPIYGSIAPTEENEQHQPDKKSENAKNAKNAKKLQANARAEKPQASPRTTAAAADAAAAIDSAIPQPDARRVRNTPRYVSPAPFSAFGKRTAAVAP